MSDYRDYAATFTDLGEFGGWTMDAALDAAHAAGYAQAVARLRDGELQAIAASAMADLSWSGKQITRFHAAYLIKQALNVIASRLEATKETTDGH